ncbi:MAG: arabinofuranan 3-O-arabinosyltransferase [Chloroflexota bacterium]|nr:arabinofuranan 3-O-arabinosyltransferase [Chloroflexota bacterium]
MRQNPVAMKFLETHARLAWTVGLGICAIAAGYVFIFRPDGGDLYPNWRAARAVLDGMPAYAQYDWPFPYLYPPGFLLPMLPLGRLDFHVAVRLFFVVNVAGIVIGTLCCLRLCRISLRSPVTPLVLAALSLTAPLLITLIQGNVNGLLVAGEGAFLLLASRNRWPAAGAALGVTLLVKPLLLPLLIIPVLWRRLDALLLAIAVPVVVSLVAFPFLSDGTAFFTRAVPYLLGGERGNELGNTTIAGVFALVHAPAWLSLIARLAVVAAAAIAVLRTPRSGELGLVGVGSIALVAAFMAFSFSSQYFALLLLPLAVSAALPGTWMAGVLAWTGMYLVNSPDLFLFYRLGRAFGVGPALGTARTLVGYAVILSALLLRAMREQRSK